MYTICSVMMTYDSKNVITVTKKDDKEYWVGHYDLELCEQVFQEKVGGNVNDYIKLKETEQSPDCQRIAYVYNNDGYFYLRTFTLKTQDHQ